MGGERAGISDVAETLLTAWRTNNAVDVFLVGSIPAELWAAPVPGIPRKTLRMVAAHIHNSRCTWLKILGRPQGIPVPVLVDRRKVSRRELIAALKRSSRGMEALLRLGIRHGGKVPPVQRTSGGTSRSTSATCCPTSWPTRGITAARSSWRRGSSAPACRRRRSTGCGSGRNVPRNSRPGR